MRNLTLMSAHHLDVTGSGATHPVASPNRTSARLTRLLRSIGFGTSWLAVWLASNWVGWILARGFPHASPVTRIGSFEGQLPGWFVAMLASLVVGAILCTITRRLWVYLLAALVGGSVAGLFPRTAVVVGSIIVEVPRSEEIIETLHEPLTVARWCKDGLVLADGRTVTLPGIPELPEKSAMLLRLVSSGVEIDPAGRIYGLIDVWHRCGNDPVGRHVARVDIARVLEFVGECGAPGPIEGAPLDEICDDVSEYGWNVSCYYSFTRRWTDATPPNGTPANDPSKVEKQ